MVNEEKSPQIVSDENWKQQAQREKEKLAQKDKKVSQADPSQADPTDSHQPTHTLPPASFMTLIESLVIQIMYALGTLQETSDSQPPINLDLAKHHIDTLQVIQDKTKNNLTEEESKALSVRLHQVRMQYVTIAQQP